MQTPELLLSKLNRALRELRGAACVLPDLDVDAKLLPVMRRLLLAEVMTDSWLVAVGGVQGAGKTTLVRTLYGLQANDPWLPANEGRGETLPILIQESLDHEAPQGYAKELLPVDESKRHFEIVEKRLDGDAFVKACRGQLPEVLLPVLRVPRRYFQHDRQALLLLPGYENRSHRNETWQDLMRQALVGAAGCVIVTDSTRLANQAQQEIVKDMMANELRTARPVIVIAKTEAFAAEPSRLEELRNSAVTAYELDGDDAGQRVICAGVDSPGVGIKYVQKWLPVLAAALRDMSIAGAASRKAQLAGLDRILAADLTKVLQGVRHHAALFSRSANGEDDAQKVLNTFLGVFDEACVRLREQHQQMVKEIMGEHYVDAWDRMQGRLECDHEGLWNNITSTFNTVTETQRKIERDVMGAWNAPVRVLDKYTARLGELIAKVGGPCLPVAPLPASASPLQCLGYIDAENKVVPAPILDAKVQSNLNALMHSKPGEILDANEKLEETVKLLPVMALEYLRIASAFPRLVHVDESTLEQLPQADLTGSVRNVKQQFGDFSDAMRDILKGVAAIMAVDVATDGDADIINALLAATGAGGTGAAAGGTIAAAGTAGLTVGSAVAGTIAIGYLAHRALQEVRCHDRRVRDLAQSMLLNTRDHHLVHFTAHFDELMGLVRSRLRQGVRRRYGLDQRLMEEDRLTKAVADVRVLQRDLRSQLALSNQAEPLFDSPAA